MRTQVSIIMAGGGGGGESEDEGPTSVELLPLRPTCKEEEKKKNRFISYKLSLIDADFSRPKQPNDG